jgi:glycosyltransferase involved in cell wall biosynthesis
MLKLLGSAVEAETLPHGSGVRAAEPRMKICMLAPTPFPANQGTPGYIREMSESIADRGHEVHIVTYHCGENIPVRGPQVHRITPLIRESTIFVGPTWKRPLYDLQMIFKTLQVLREYQPDLMHAHGYEAALIAWGCRLLTRVPFLYSGSNTMGDELASYVGRGWKWLFQGLAKALDAVVPRLADRCIPHSDNMSRFFHTRGLGSRTEPTVPFGINLEEAAQGNPTAVRKRYGLGEGPVILYTGLLDRFQRLDLLLEAFAHVSFYEPEARLFIVTGINNDQHLPGLRECAARHGVADRVIVTDPLPLEEVRECILAGDVAVVSRPHVPGYPIKLLNYMAAARPCVLYASSANRALRDREHAMLVAPDTGLALGEGILEVLRDSSLRHRIARGGYRYVREHHDRRVVAQRVCEAYVRLLEATGRAHRLQGRPPATVETPAEPEFHFAENGKSNGSTLHAGENGRLGAFELSPWSAPAGVLNGTVLAHAHHNGTSHG